MDGTKSLNQMMKRFGHFLIFSAVHDKQTPALRTKGQMTNFSSRITRRGITLPYDMDRVYPIVFLYRMGIPHWAGIRPPARERGYLFTLIFTAAATQTRTRAG